MEADEATDDLAHDLVRIAGSVLASLTSSLP
jgi:hypothetical protein